MWNLPLTQSPSPPLTLHPPYCLLVIGWSLLHALAKAALLPTASAIVAASSPDEISQHHFILCSTLSSGLLISTPIAPTTATSDETTEFHFPSVVRRLTDFSIADCAYSVAHTRNLANLIDGPLRRDNQNTVKHWVLFHARSFM